MEYPDGGGEVAAWQVAPPRAKDDPGSGRLAGGVKRRPEANEERAAARAASRVRRLVRQSELRRMTTLTWPAPGEHARGRAMAAVAGYLERWGKLVHSGWPYVVVPELHPGGHGWHIHVFSQGGRVTLKQLGALRGTWTRYLLRRGWALPAGVSCVRTHVRIWRSARDAGRYAGKYAAKALSVAGGRDKGRRRYTISLGLHLRVTVLDPMADWWEMLRCAGDRVVRAAWRSWEEGQDPGGWPVAWAAFG